jgi:hypothetical protein
MNLRAMALTLFMVCLCPLWSWAQGDQGRYLLLDGRMIERVENADLRLGTMEKHPANPLFGEEHPWEARFDNLYPNVIRDEQEGIYKIWYKTFTRDAVTEDGQAVPTAQRVRGTYGKFPRKRGDGLCYAVSRDGLKWEKPLLDLHPWEGQPSNLVAVGNHGVGVFKDLHETDPARRYKMLMRSGSMAVRFSADGLHWGEIVSCREIDAAGDSHNNAFWSPERKAYVGITRLFAQGPRQRVVGWTESRDFVNWTPAKEVLRGEPTAQLYSMPVFRYAGVYLGLPAIFDTREDRVHTELAWSPDTITWRRIEPGRALIPRGKTDGDYDWGCVYASVPVILKDQVRIYYGASNGPHTDWRDTYLALATLRPDGFAGYAPQDPSRPAVVVTRTLEAAGGEVRITADIEPGGWVEATLFDEKGNAQAVGRRVTRSVTDGLAVALDPRQRGKVRLRLQFQRAQVYSFVVGSAM